VREGFAFEEECKPLRRFCRFLFAATKERASRGSCTSAAANNMGKLRLSPSKTISDIFLQRVSFISRLPAFVKTTYLEPAGALEFLGVTLRSCVDVLISFLPILSRSVCL